MRYNLGYSWLSVIFVFFTIIQQSVYKLQTYGVSQPQIWEGWEQHVSQVWDGWASSGCRKYVVIRVPLDSTKCCYA